MVSRYSHSSCYLGVPLLLILLCSSILKGQENTVYKFSDYPGFPKAKLTASAIDKEGFLWLASEKGIYHFDGNSFYSFGSPLSQFHTFAFIRYSNGVFLAITTQGLVQIDPNLEASTFAIHSSMKAFPEPGIFSDYRTHLVDSSGALWVATDEVILRYFNGYWESFFLPTQQKSKGGSLPILVEDSSNQVWYIPNSSVLFHFDLHSYSWVEKENPTSLAFISSAIVHPDKGLCLLGNGLSLLDINPQGVVEIERFTNDTVHIVQSVLMNSEELLLVGIEGTAFQVNPSHSIVDWNPVYESIGQHGFRALAFEDIQEFNPQKEGIWVVEQRKLSFLKRPFFQNFTQLPRRPSNFSLGSDSAVYVAYGKVYKVTGKEFEWKVSELNLDPRVLGHVTAVCKNRRGLWLGNSDGKLFWKKDSTLIELPFSKPSGMLFYLYSDYDENVWVSRAPSIYPLKGVERIDPSGKVKHYGEKEGLESRALVSFQGEDSTLYIGGVGSTSYLYVYLKHEDRFENISPQLPFRHLLRDNFEVHDLRVDSLGQIWLATTHGLFISASGKLLQVDLGEKFTDGEVRSIEFDREGSLWISTEKDGLLRYSDKKIMVFDEKAGLPDEVMNYRTLR
ncbi:MAG: hypothetical protein AAGA10_04870, partial [Bacteroidota bacterium]